MVKEDYVSYETAKLLKEKGFDEKCFYCFDDVIGESRLSRLLICNNSELVEHYYSAPTLQMAMKWLREVHKIEIRVIYDNEKLCWYGACNPMNEPSQILLGFGRKSKSYEEACEEAIKYGLENLIKA